MTNLETEKTLDTLSELCCDTLCGEGRSLADRRKGLLKSLLECGYARQATQPLQVELENRVRKRWSKPILFHRDELLALTAGLQREFNKLKRAEVNLPQETDPPEAANINTAGRATKRRPPSQ